MKKTDKEYAANAKEMMKMMMMLRVMMKKKMMMLLRVMIRMTAVVNVSEVSVDSERDAQSQLTE